MSAAAASAEAAGRKAAEEEVQRLNGEVSRTFLSVADKNTHFSDFTLNQPRTYKCIRGLHKSIRIYIGF